MACISVFYWCTILYLSMIIVSCLSIHHEDIIDTKALNVGQELEKESLPIHMGQRLYQLHGLKPSSWYEVKISYPASIPARFAIELTKNDSELQLFKNRRLLNTEKLIFEANTNDLSDHDELYVLVTVEAAGIVAKPFVQERENVLFNIVCDELSYGIPYKAWCVGMAAALCLVFAFLIPHFLPSHLLLKNRSSPTSNPSPTKTS